MKILTNDEVIEIVGLCRGCNGEIAENCPLVKECFYYYTGEKCGSCLESEEKEND
jgi:hypothetical protein